ncbi:MAG: hypothetical protein QGH47_01260 [Candidatus Woesearchaeota archaeon]|jgi:hypothetical protein|nr:hypothetical protein [Candidatus Woesearchaeota archaeon]
MQKRGQITLYLIVAVFVLAIASYFIYETSSKTDSDASTEVLRKLSPGFNVEFIDEYMPSCMEEQSRQGFYKVALQGGFYDPNPAFQVGGTDIGYYIYQGQDTIPTPDELALEIFEHIELNMTLGCLDIDLAGGSMKILEMEPEIIASNDVLLSYSVKLELLSPDARRLVKTYETKITDGRLIEAYNLASQASSAHDPANPSICINCPLTGVNNADFIAGFNPYGDVWLLTIADLNDSAFIFNVAFELT